MSTEEWILYLRLIKDLGTHVALGAHSRVWRNVQCSCRLRVRHGQTKVRYHTRPVVLY